jgi:hypothetical protein
MIFKKVFDPCSYRSIDIHEAENFSASLATEFHDKLI